MNDILQNLRTFCEEYGLTFEQFAEYSGVDDKSINNWLSGRHKISERNGMKIEQFMSNYAKTHAKQMSLGDMLKDRGGRVEIRATELPIPPGASKEDVEKVIHEVAGRAGFKAAPLSEMPREVAAGLHEALENMMRRDSKQEEEEEHGDEINDSGLEVCVHDVHDVLNSIRKNGDLKPKRRMVLLMKMAELFMISAERSDGRR